MKTFTQKDFLDMCHEVQNQKSDKLEDFLTMCQDIQDYQYGKVENETDNEMVDITNTKSNDIKNQLIESNTLRVGNFVVEVEYFDNDSTVSMTIKEFSFRTPAGFACKMQQNFSLEDDNRFSGKTWLKSFKYNRSCRIPINTAIEIIRWLQAINKLALFL